MSYNGFNLYDTNAVVRLLQPAGAAGTASGYTRALQAYQATFAPASDGPASMLPIRVGRLRAALWLRSDGNGVPTWYPEPEQP